METSTLATVRPSEAFLRDFSRNTFVRLNTVRCGYIMTTSAARDTRMRVSIDPKAFLSRA